MEQVILQEEKSTEWENSTKHKKKIFQSLEMELRELNKLFAAEK